MTVVARNSAHRGFSLLELVLAIGLSISLVALLGFAIDLHLIRLDSSRSTIEEAQVARAVLDRIASDLRAATTAPTQDVSELMEAAEQAAQFNVDEVDQSQDDADTSSESDDGSDEPMPGINGNAESVTIDRRRVAQSLTTPAAGGAPVAGLNAAWSQVVYGMSTVSDQPGLIRTESARDVAMLLAERGQGVALTAPIASEVLRVQFMYYSGDQAVDTWDMFDQEALPTAVEVRIELQPAETDGPASVEDQQVRTYRRFVRLPAAVEELDEESNESSDIEEATL